MPIAADEGIVFRYRTGVAWRDLPGRFGPWQTVCMRRGLSTRIHAEVDGRGRPLAILLNPGQARDPRGRPVTYDRTACRGRNVSERAFNGFHTLARAGHQIRQARHRLPRRPRLAAVLLWLTDLGDSS